MNPIRRYLSTHRRLRDIIRRRDAALLKRLEVRCRRAWCSWEDEDGSSATVTTNAMEILPWEEVVRAFGRWRR